MANRHPMLLSTHWALPMIGATIMLLAACQPIRPLTPTPVAATAQAETTTADATAADAMAAIHAPVAIAIPAIALSAPVVPMGWEEALVDGTRTTQWVVPADAVGWPVNGVELGAGGRIVLAGQQATEAAPFAALARGEVEPGQEIQLSDGAGATYVYTVIEVSEPIALIGATAEDEAAAAAYVAPTDDALLTLITGWPDFTTTHRIFAVAEYTSVSQ